MNFKANSLYTVLVVTMTLFFFSCKDEKQPDKTGNTKEALTETAADSSENYMAIVYRNTLNTITDINVTIKKKGTFVYYQAPLSKPTSGEIPKTTTLSGTWTKRDHWIVLTFNDKDVKANTIFIPSTSQEDHFKIIDDTTVEIDGNQKEIAILGIPCIKSIIR